MLYLLDFQDFRDLNEISQPITYIPKFLLLDNVQEMEGSIPLPPTPPIHLKRKALRS